MNFNIERQKIESQAKKLAKKGKFLDAIKQYQKLISGDERDIEVWNTVGELYLKENRKSEGAKEFQKIASFYEERGLYSKAIGIYKKINRLDPENIESGERLADLYRKQGFNTEAKSEYLRLAEELKNKKKFQDAAILYEKLLKIDPTDTQSRLILADLYTKESQIDQAVEALNQVAELKLRQNELEDVEDILAQARALQPDDSRTLSNLLELLKNKGKKKEALSLVEEILQKDKDHLKALYYLGQVHFEKNDFEKAESIFSRILSIRPKEAEARVKLGQIYIQKGQLNQAFELYDPLVDALLRKHKEERAIGLLGLIVASKKIHLPTLEKLALVYKSLNQKNSLEVVYSLLLDEYRKVNLKEKMLPLLSELVALSPENEEYYHENRKLKKELGILEEGKEAEQPSLRVNEAAQVIDTHLAKVDLYVEEGLIRNARRILEDLRRRFPFDDRIEQKTEELKTLKSHVDEEEIAKRLQEVSKRETQLFGKMAETVSRPTPVPKEEPAEEKITAADIFAETDILPIVPQEEVEKRHFELSVQIEDELEAIRSVIRNQLKGDTATMEKELSEIVSDFKKSIEEKVSEDAYESHHSLGLVFLEQGLLDEAINEFQLSSKNNTLSLEGYSLLSVCYRKKGDYKTALKWIQKASALAEEKTASHFALQYEMAVVLEEMEERKKALKILQDIQKWNPDYRDVKKKVESLKKA